jgi:ATP-binding cassette subfamily B protein
MLGAKVVNPIKGLITFFADTYIISGAMAQIGSIWNANPERVGSGTQQVIKGGYKLRDLTVRFGDHDALKKVNLEIPARAKVAVVGLSASGKSTLLRLLQGLLKPNDGIIEVDGGNLASLDVGNYRSQVALVDLHPTFFAGTIEENIRRVRPSISAREMEVIMQQSGLADLINLFPDGLSTMIDQSANNLSQAHKIIISLTRALATNPNLLLLDETFNSLDKQSQVHLKVNMDKIASGRTLVATTHDMRFMADFDWIIVLNHGEVAGQGQHDELLANCPLYKEMWALELQIGSVENVVDEKKSIAGRSKR